MESGNQEETKMLPSRYSSLPYYIQRVTIFGGLVVKTGNSHVALEETQVLQELPGCDENRCHTTMIMQEGVKFNSSYIKRCVASEKNPHESRIC